MRNLFAAAKAKSPCIVFIDEVDAVGEWQEKVVVRGTDCLWSITCSCTCFIPQSILLPLHASHSCIPPGTHPHPSQRPPHDCHPGGKRTNWEASGGSRKTLNQLLTEMDGFEENSGVVVMAATNLPETLDPALTRPGRFDRQVAVPLPDVHGRRAILDLYFKGKPLAADVDSDSLARRTPGGVRLGGGLGVDLVWGNPVCRTSTAGSCRVPCH